MRPDIRILFAFTLLLSVTACSTAGLRPSSPDELHYVTIEEIKHSLPSAPVIVGFDIDDTLLFSSPGFYYGLTNDEGPGGSNRYGSDPLHSPRFWNDMNGQFDKFSLPKKSAAEIIAMHHSRGDELVFITARTGSRKPIVSSVLARTFQIPEPEVIFTAGSSKTPFMLAKKISIYYGDADADMSDASAAKVRPIRVLRPPLSTNKASKYNPGLYGEEVVVRSDI